MNWIFIPKFGYFAAGYTTLASYVCLAVMHGLMYRYTIKIKGISEKVYDLKKIVLIAVGMIGTGLGSALLYKGFLIRYLIIIGIIIGVISGRKRIKEKII